MKLPAEIPWENLKVVVDNREKRPFNLGMPTVGGHLPTGDYALEACPDLAVVERKSVVDLVSCVSHERARFQREIKRLLSYPARLVVVEGTLDEIRMGQWRGRTLPQSVVSSCLAWMGEGIPFLFCNGHEEAGKLASKWFQLVARRRWRELRGLAPSDPRVGYVLKLGNEKASTARGDSPFPEVGS